MDHQPSVSLSIPMPIKPMRSRKTPPPEDCRHQQKTWMIYGIKHDESNFFKAIEHPDVQFASWGRFPPTTPDERPYFHGLIVYKRQKSRTFVRTALCTDDVHPITHEEVRRNILFTQSMSLAGSKGVQPVVRSHDRKRWSATASNQ